MVAVCVGEKEKNQNMIEVGTQCALWIVFLRNCVNESKKTPSKSSAFFECVEPSSCRIWNEDLLFHSCSSPLLFTNFPFFHAEDHYWISAKRKMKNDIENRNKDEVGLASELHVCRSMQWRFNYLPLNAFFLHLSLISLSPLGSFLLCVLIWISTNLFFNGLQWLDDLIFNGQLFYWKRSEIGIRFKFGWQRSIRRITKRLWWITRKEIWISNRVDDWHVHTRAEIVEIK